MDNLPCFGIQVMSSFDREYLVSELSFKDEFFAEINQENVFFEIVFYHGGDIVCMKFPLEKFQDCLQFAKVDLIGDTYNEALRLRSNFLEEVKRNYVKECKIIILPPSQEKKKEFAQILHNDELLAEVTQEDNFLEVTFYYHNKNIGLPIESLQELLQDAKVKLTSNS